MGDYTVGRPVIHKVLKLRIWGVPPAGGPLLKLPTARAETSSSVVCGAKERTDVGAELGTDDLVGAELGEVRNSKFRTCIALPQGSAI